MNCLICENSLIVRGSNSENNDVMFCSNCNLHSTNSNKQTASKNLKERYLGDFWLESNYNLKELLDSNFSSKKGWDYLVAQESMFEYYKQFLKNKNKILEIGVGTGIHLLAFDKLGFDVTGIEPDPTSSKLINEKLIHGECINGFFEDMNFEHKFDIVFFYHVMEHLENPKRILERCRNLLNENGLIIIAVPDCENQFTLNASIKNPYHLWHFSKQSLEKLSVQLNYNVVKIDSFSRLPKNHRRFYKILKKLKLNFLTKKFSLFYPLMLNTNNDGYEIRLILNKNNL